MSRIITIISFLILGLISTTYSQQITVGTTEPGPYGRLSSIAVPVKIEDNQGKLQVDNIFKLYLSDANGSFSNEREIGTYKGFYTTFINGIIPNDIAGGTYKLRVKSFNPNVISNVSNSIQVDTKEGVEAAIDAPISQLLSLNPRTFGNCEEIPGSLFSFTNISTSGSSVTAQFKDEFNNAEPKTLTFGSSNVNFRAEVTFYTITVKALKDGIVGTKGYFLVNTPTHTPFSVPSSSIVCLPRGILEYGVESSSPTGIQYNFPGNTYQVNWGDDGVELYTLNQIRANGSKVKHTYYKSSCGKEIKINNTTYYNVFGIIIQAQSPFCKSIGVPVSSQAKVVSQPENRFTLPAFACINTPLTIENISLLGDNPSNTSAECENNDVLYFWYVDDELVTPDGVSLSYKLKHKFTTPGKHVVKLESKSTSRCQAAVAEKEIWIQTPPKPDFKLNGTIYCVSSAIKATDLSVVDNGNDAPNTYDWSITGPSEPLFMGGTSASSKNPEFQVSAPGIYVIKLTITSSCEPVSTTERQVVINDKPVITANWQTNLCGKGQLLTFTNTSGNPVPTNITGISKDGTGTYEWTITGGAYAFRNGTSSNSKEPAILFKDYGTYLVTITVKNNCGVAVESREITFNESPTLNAGDDMTSCAGNPINLKGSITGPPVVGFTWTGGTGTFSPSREVLEPIYAPSPEEILAGKVELSLSATTTNPAPCDKVLDVVVITINPANKIFSESEKTICTGSAVKYHPISTIEDSKISWTAVGSSNASGFSASGTGDIDEVITNTNPNANATVTYTIIAEANGCQGEAFTFTVTVSPMAGVQAKVPNRTVCSGQPGTINLVPTVSNTLYTWTSSVTGNILGNKNQETPVATTSIKDVLTNTEGSDGTVTYSITPITSTGCPGEPVSVTIIVSAAPIVANAGEDQKLCSVTSVQLSANNPGKGTGRWTVTSRQTGLTFDNLLNHNAVVTGLLAGQVYDFKWTITGPGSCNSTEDHVVISNLSPVANNGISYAGATVCEGSSITIDGSAVSGGDGIYSYKWEASEDGTLWTSVNTNDSKDLTVVAKAPTFFRRSVLSGDCSALSNIIKIDVQKGITNNTISGDQSVCYNTVPVKLTGTDPEGADGNYNYQWQQRTEGAAWANIIGATASTYSPAALILTTSYRRIVTSKLCQGEQQNSSNEVVVKVLNGFKANYTYLTESSCAPYSITATNIKAEASEPDDIYEWFVNNISIGKGIDFPGYVLKNEGDVADVRLEVTSGSGCGKKSFSHTFKTRTGIAAKITADKLQGCGPVVVNFANKTSDSEGIDFEWNFGNGQRSFVKDPAAMSFSARSDGKDTIYVVTLKATSTCAVSTDTLKIKVIGKPTPKFSPDVVTGCSPLKITFKNLSPGSSNTYVWNFGDGQTETTYDNAAVSHVFRSSKAKIFSVSLTVKNECGEKTVSYNISVSPNTIQPDWIINANELSGCSPHKVTFNNNTVGASRYIYDFADGSAPDTVYTDDAVEHTFKKGGVYTVKLTASNCGDTTIYKRITVFQGAEMNFTADVKEGCAPLSVRFTNQSINAVTYKWDFGDGTSYSGSTPPAHVYTSKQESYTVKLITKSNAGCIDTLVMKDYIKVIAPPVAAFKAEPGFIIQYPNYRFSFKTTTREKYSDVIWDFGDGSPYNTSIEPEHSYPDTGIYKVKLTVKNSMGCSDVIEQAVRITGTPGALFIPNAFMPNSATEELRKFSAKGSGLAVWKMRIFNKWGELIWETDKLDSFGSPVEGWDGTAKGVLAPQGVYFWEVTAKFKNGTEWAGMPYKNSSPKKAGDLHLIR